MNEFYSTATSAKRHEKGRFRLYVRNVPVLFGKCDIEDNCVVKSEVVPRRVSTVGVVGTKM